MTGATDVDGAGGGLGAGRRCSQHSARRTVGRGGAARAPAVALGLVLVMCLSQAGVVWGWQDWDFYNINVTDWNPGPRRGHSMHLWNNSVYLFGGRANDKDAEHVPKTYEIVTINGTLQFSTYDEKPVQEACANLTSPDCQRFIPLGVMMNDIWEYPLDCTRWSDLSCRHEGWKVIDPGAVLGGCAINDGIERCSHPTERWEHTSAMFDDGTLIVYGGFSLRCEDFCSDVWRFRIGDCKWQPDDPTACKWQELNVLGRSGPGRRWKAASVRDGGVFYMYGGHRMWHGFGETNSVENKWADTFQYAFGGYMDDLWRYTYADNSWYEIPRIQSCFPNPGIEWADRFNLRCLVFWPPQRAGGVLLMYNNTLLLHGGYRTFFPYPHTNARGAGPGTATIGSDGFTPYPTYPFYLDDLWEYSFVTGKWQERLATSITPAARTEHSIIIAGDVFILFGGYRSNYYFGDMWLFNITTNTWLEKREYVHALYPPNCTDDTELLDGVGEVVRSTSVFGQPTRFTTLDLQFGRSGEHVFIEQPRRRAPGWDGCRDRLDGRLDLPVALQWLRPAQRSGHRAIYSDKHRLMLVYGGEANVVEQQQAFDISHATHVVGDMWQHHLDHCPKNCSLHGHCFHGYCYCDDGYYGIDCSNISCPGTFCYMNTDNHQQICHHCCHAGYSHVDDEWYVEDKRKVPCSLDLIGEMHGICDGFGNCQCAPPFMTRDCSVRDCPNNCSYNGWCDIQYPVGRCMCDAGWVGKDCNERVCLNNCSYPNGECQDGVCICAMTYNPYNRTVEYVPFTGDDCSFVTPFAAAGINTWSAIQLLATAAVVVALQRNNALFAAGRQDEDG